MTKGRAKLVRKTLSEDSIRVIEGRKKPIVLPKAAGPKIDIRSIAAAGAKTKNRRKKG